jgi:hypothetical protein
MNLFNATGMEAGYTMGLRPDARELLVVVVKGTFTIPESGQIPTLTAAQVPIVDADVFTGVPGFSSTLYECDYAPFKPRCDVLLNGSAYAPGDKSSRRVTVTLEVGRMSKRFNVVGDRVWKKGLFGIHASRPRPFKAMQISYDNAFGGVDNLHENPLKHVTHLLNFAGKGFFPASGGRKIDGKPLANTEEVRKPVKSPRAKYRPIAFGAIGRAWQPRLKFGGTYDQKWVDHIFPFLPSDFDDRYYQAAPHDQQVDYLQGGEEVKLTNLMPRNNVEFRLPCIDMPIAFFRKGEKDLEIRGTCDTLIIEPDLKRFIMLWRAALPLRKNLFEIKQVIAGRMPRAWYRARRSGKAYYASIQDLIDSQEPKRKTEIQTEAEEKEEEIEASVL